MRVCLNALLYYPGELGGVETYFQNLLGYLPQVGPQHEYVVVGHHGNRDSLAKHGDRWRVEILPYGRPCLGWALRGAWLKLGGGDFLAPWFERLGVEVVHHPFTMLSPMESRVPTVLTFHDMQQEYLPEFFGSQVLRERQRRFRRSTARATRIIAISEHVKKSLEDRYHVASERVDVVYQGCAPEFRVLPDADTEPLLRSLLGVHPPFALYPAATWPHKNHVRLLTAIRRLKDAGRFDGQLLLTGLPMEAEDDVNQAIVELRLEAVVRRLGFVSKRELVALYNQARLLVFPSLFEGFGIPLLEAMACGCPVAAAKVTSIPEVAGEAAEYFDPWSVDSIARAIETLWHDAKRREALRAAGLQRVPAFSWERAARRTMDVYRRALEQGPPVGQR